ncbi:MAG: hypothetical protein PHO15_11920, partial [Eubacteriales bacterium]|nr:hypothetical protein [Eubacteriales bacterium]
EFGIELVKKYDFLSWQIKLVDSFISLVDLSGSMPKFFGVSGNTKGAGYFRESKYITAGA